METHENIFLDQDGLVVLSEDGDILLGLEGDPCCCGQNGGCACETVALVGCNGAEVPGSCCNWGQARRQTLALTFSIGYDKPSTPNNPFTCQASLSGQLDAVRTVTCADGQETVTYDVSDFALSGSAVTSTGRAVSMSVTRETFPIEFGTFEAWLEGMFLRVGETCHTGATNRLQSLAALARAMLVGRIEPVSEGERYAVPDPTAGFYFGTNNGACNPAFEGFRCDCPTSFTYRRAGGLPFSVSFGVFGWTEDPSYNWTASSCECRRTVYAAGNQYDLQDDGAGNFAGRISINGAYTHVVSDVVECVPNPCNEEPPGPPPPPGYGACVLRDGSCLVTTAMDCYNRTFLRWTEGVPCEAGRGGCADCDREGL